MSIITRIKNFITRHSSLYRFQVIGTRVYDISEPWHENDVMPPPIEAQAALDELVRYFLGKDYYITSPVNAKQANSELIYTIMINYRGNKKYYKELEKKYGTIQKHS